LDNPVLQNQAHVHAVDGFLGDLRVPICGYVVSAGRARFAPEIADAVVSLGDLSWVLSISFAEPNPRVLDAGVAAARARGGEERRPPRHARGVCAPPTGGVASAAAVIACAPGVLRTPEGGLPRRDLGHMLPQFRVSFDGRRAPAITVALTRRAAAALIEAGSFSG
jgi:hypothetical protein